MQPFGHNRNGPKIGEGALPPSSGRGAGSPSSTLWRGRRPIFVPSAAMIHSAVWPQWTWAENCGGGYAPFWGGGAWSPSNTKSPGPSPTSIPSGILIHSAIWPQQIWTENWGLCHFWEGELGSHLTQCDQGRGLPACRVSS